MTLKYGIKAEEVKAFARMKGISLPEAHRIFKRDYLAAQVVAAESFEDLKPAILAILEGDV